MLPVVELFTSIQGEGKFTGKPSHFIRVSGCNLRCVFKGSICDTPYSSFAPENGITDGTVEGLLKAFAEEHAKYPNTEHVVITGGEPMLYAKELKEFLVRLNLEFGRPIVTIETNGTLPPLDIPIDLYSVSPKLSTSVGQAGVYYGSYGPRSGYTLTEAQVTTHIQKRINYRNLHDYMLKSIRFGTDYQFKFVYSGRECVLEIEDILNKAFIPSDSHIMLMPEGVTNEQLDAKRKEIADVCVSKGWSFTDREHIIIWGDKRGV